MEEVNESRRREYQARSNEIISVFSKIFLEDIDDKISAHLEMREPRGMSGTDGQYEWSEKDLV